MFFQFCQYATSHIHRIVKFVAMVSMSLILTTRFDAQGLEQLPTTKFSTSKPNIVFILADNLGNGDVKCFNPETLHRTPNLDRMAAEGMKLTSFYSASGVCTPSRAALMTGCYPRRINMHISDKATSVLQPVAAKGLHPDETTIAEVLKSVGYATTIIGKWHLGDQLEFLPTEQGFDSYLGIPYSDDMVQEKNPDVWPPIPLMQNATVVEAPVELPPLTKRYTQAAIHFMEEHREKPFFLFLSHATPGSTRTSFSGVEFVGKSANGAWGDSIEEIDWSTGEILAALKRLNLDEKTLVVWTSDNGALLRPEVEHGSNLPYKGLGYTTSEGGMRMPCIVRWPGTIRPAEECRELCAMMDWLPTIAGLSNATLPTKKIDGQDIRAMLFSNPQAKSRYDATGFFYYQIKQLQAVRSGPWKLYLPIVKQANAKIKKEPVAISLYNVLEDVGETQEVSQQHPEIISRMLQMAEHARATLGDEEKPGSEQRPAGNVELPTARRLP